MAISIKVTPQWCRKIGWAGVALIWMGVLLPWRGDEAYSRSFVSHFPVTSAGLCLAASGCAFFFGRRSPYPVLGLLAVLAGWGEPALGQFYFGRYTVLSWANHASPFAATGGVLFDFGLFLIGAGALGLLRPPAGIAKNGSGQTAAETAGTAADLAGQWRLTAIGQRRQTFPAQIVIGIMNQRWGFKSGGRLVVRTFGFRKQLFYTSDRQTLVIRDARGTLRGRWTFVRREASVLELQRADHQGIYYRLERAAK